MRGRTDVPFVVSGNLGPRGDGYVPGALMSADEARRYHGAQIATFAGTEADLVTVFTMNYVEEAIGIASNARQIASTWRWSVPQQPPTTRSRGMTSRRRT